MFQTKAVEHKETHFVFSNFLLKNRAAYEIMWRNIVEPDRLHVNVAHAHCMLDT